MLKIKPHHIRVSRRSGRHPDVMGVMIGFIFFNGIFCLYYFLKRFISPYYWNHMDRLPMMLFLTAYPVQKNIILQ